MVIVSHVESRLPCFKYHSLMQEITEHYLEVYESIYINNVAKKELYRYESRQGQENKYDEKRRIYIFIYDERAKIAGLRYQIPRHVLPTYMSSILTPTPIQKETIMSIKSYMQVLEEIKCLGENVYIGIIGTQGIDYRKGYLGNESKATRVACIWD